MLMRCGVLTAMLLVLLPIGGVGQVAWQESVAEAVSAAEAAWSGPSRAPGEEAYVASSLEHVEAARREAAP